MSLEIISKSGLEPTHIVKPKRDTVLYVDTMEFEPTEKLKIYLQQEPEAIVPLANQIIQDHARYDIILTFNEQVLRSCKNARLFNFYTPTWLDESQYMSIDTSKKQYKISSCTGSKQITGGHRFRLALYYAQELFAGDRFVFFRSGVEPILPSLLGENLILGSSTHSKFALFETFQFSLVIENSRQKDYFTEKLMDCVISKTIPIYYGCSNIHEYFDTRGWIILENEDIHGMLEKCEVLHESYYSIWKDTIEENYKRAFQYKDIISRLNQMLQSIPEYSS